MHFNLHYHWGSCGCVGLGDLEGIVPQKEALYKLQQYLDGVNSRVGEPCCGPGCYQVIAKANQTVRLQWKHGSWTLTQHQKATQPSPKEAAWEATVAATMNINSGPGYFRIRYPQMCLVRKLIWGYCNGPAWGAELFPHSTSHLSPWTQVAHSAQSFSSFPHFFLYVSFHGV